MNKKGKAHENRTKEGLMTRGRTLSGPNGLMASPIYIGQAQGEEEKNMQKEESKLNWGFSSFWLFWFAHPYASRMYFPMLAKENWAVTQSYNTGLSVPSNFCCSETEPMKLHTPLTSMVPWLRFNLIEKPPLSPREVEDKHNRKPNSAKAPVVEAGREENPAQGQWQEAECTRNGDSKTNSAESSHSSVSDSRKSPVKAGGPRSYGWKDVWLTKA